MLSHHLFSSLSTIRDADQIYVVGAGQVIEHGTHNELLANEDGPYTQLVSAQKLKGRNPDTPDPELAVADTAGQPLTQAEVEEAMQAEQPLERSRTGSGRSLASEILDKKKQEVGQFGDKDYNLPYLFKRMGEINRDDLYLYIGGVIAAIGEYSLLSFPCRFTVTDLRKLHSGRHGLSCVRYCLRASHFFLLPARSSCTSNGGGPQRTLAVLDCHMFDHRHRQSGLFLQSSGCFLDQQT